MAMAMVDCWQLATIGMWVDKLDAGGALKLICDTFTWETLWEGAVELNQQVAGKQLDKKIPMNRDQGEQKDRVKILGSNILASLQELKNVADPPAFVVTSTSLAFVPGVVKSNVEAEPAVTARLDNIEKMMENLSKGFSELKKGQPNQWPALQLNGVPLPAEGAVLGHAAAQGGGHRPPQQARNRQQATLPIGGQGLRDRSDSRKRKAEAEQVQANQHEQVPEQDQAGQRPWNQVVAGRGRRKVQYGTSQVKVTGGEAAPYDVFVGNTHPDTTENIIKEVLAQVALKMPEDMKLEEPLQILEVECLTKPRTDGRKLWTKNWRVQVSNRFREHMLRPEAYPMGWSSRRYFPALRAARPPVPPLNPVQHQPDPKRPNLGPSQDGTASADQ